MNVFLRGVGLGGFIRSSQERADETNESSNHRQRVRPLGTQHLAMHERVTIDDRQI